MTKIVVYHSQYGCDTGCCGHAIYMNRSKNEGDSKYAWVFDHPDDDPDNKETSLEFAKRVIKEKFGEEHVKDLDWDNCSIVNIMDC